MLWLYILLLLGGLFILIKGSDIFVDGSVKIANMFDLSEMFIGMTLVCFGTGLPELILSLIGNFKGTAELVIGNMVGTNIFNICCILGLICVISPVKLVRDTVKKDMYMSLVTGIVFLLVLLDTPFKHMDLNIITIPDSLILIIFFIVYMYYTLYHFEGLTDKRRKKKEAKDLGIKIEKVQHITKENRRKLWENVFLCFIGAVMVYVGSETLLSGAVGIAECFGLSQALIAIIILGPGTSLPEIATSITALKKGSINVAIGNLIGSNMYNMLFIVGVTSLIKPLVLVSTTIWIDCILFIIICIALVVFAKIKFIDKGQYELSRAEGITLLAIYVCYIIYVVYRG